MFAASASGNDPRLIPGSDYSIRDDEFHAFRDLIFAEAGIALGSAKRDLVCSRLSKRLRHFGFGTFAEYYQYLMKEDPNREERRRMVNCITTNKTDFFRESHHFDFLETSLLPELCARARQGGPRKLRIWSAGCSTGEEPYTIAMRLSECLDPTSGWDVRILASDIDTDCLDKAAKGIYGEDRVETVPKNLRSKYFHRGTGANIGQVSVRPHLRQPITFRRINLVEESWPIRTRFDAIFCRNVIIYFNRETQLKLLNRLASCLEPGGYLFLGHSESLHGLTDGLFLSLGGNIYQLRGAPVPRPLTQAAVQSWSSDTPDNVMPIRRTEPPCAPVGESSYGGIAPTFADRTVLFEESLMVGDVRANREPTVFKTVLGSCVSACLFDPETKIGGMNHFCLPSRTGDESLSCRFGVHAMELLINEIMRLGGDRRRLRAKVFGGARVVDISSPIGPSNARFVTEFLKNERIPVVADNLGGTTGLCLHFYSHTGKAMVKHLETSILNNTIAEDKRSTQVLIEKLTRPAAETVVLF